jgi:hypothetical protein
MSVKPKNLQFFIVRSVLEVVRTVQRGRVLREQTPTDPNQKEKNIHLDGRRTTGLSSLLVFLLPTLSVKWTSSGGSKCNSLWPVIFCSDCYAYMT